MPSSRSASTDSCPVGSAATTAQHGAGIQVAARSTTSSAIFVRVERGVDRPHDVEERVPALDAAAQRTLQSRGAGRPGPGAVSATVTGRRASARIRAVRRLPLADGSSLDLLEASLEASGWAPDR